VLFRHRPQQPIDLLRLGQLLTQAGKLIGKLGQFLGIHNHRCQVAVLVKRRLIHNYSPVI
jgi:hypothetical protein